MKHWETSEQALANTKCAFKNEDFAVLLLFLDGSEATRVGGGMFEWQRSHGSWGRRQVMRLPRPADHLHRSQPPIQPPAPAGLV